MKIVISVLCLIVIVSSQEFGIDGMGSLMFYNALSNRPMLDFNMLNQQQSYIGVNGSPQGGQYGAGGSSLGSILGLSILTDGGIF